MRNIIFYVGIFLFTSSCDKEEGCSNPPVDRLLAFRIVDLNNTDLLDSANSNYLGKVRTVNPCTDQNFGTTIYRDSVFYYCEAQRISYEGVLVDLVCKEILLEYEDGDIDTVVYEIEQNIVSGCPIRKMRNVTFNSKKAILTTSNSHAYYTFVK